MSAALSYQEPYRFSAGMLALAVHLAFFSLLYFGVRWQSQPPDAFMVEMWDSLPKTETISVPQPTIPAELAPPPREAAPVPMPAKPDIELLEKQQAEAKRKQAKLAEEKARTVSAAQAKLEQEQRELDEYALRRMQAEQARVRAEVDAATATQVGRYQDMIRGKIRRNIVMPPNVPESAVAEFKVTLLPSGDVLEVELLKSSGHTAYDDAAERAIYKAQPLPLPADAGLQKLFRELKLTIRP